MDEQRFERDLRDGLAALLDPVFERNPRWETSPAARQVVATPTQRAFSGRLGMLWAAALVALLLVALLAATVFVGARRPDRAVVIGPSPTPAATCPAGSTPDEPGPVDQARPPAAEYPGPMVWNGAAGRMVLLASETWEDFVARRDIRDPNDVMPGTVTWTFDVCTNRWTQGRVDTALPDGGLLVYDEDSDLTLLIGGDGYVWSYELGSDTWTRRDGLTPRIAQAAYDPVSGLVLGRRGIDGAMWTFDVDTDTWRVVYQGDLVPPSAERSQFQFVSFDRSADRLVLYLETRILEPSGKSAHGTWLFDPRAGSWAHVSYMVPISFFIGGDWMVYGEADERTLIYGDASVAAFDARTKKWEYLYGTGTPGTVRDSRFDRGVGATAYDPLNRRLVMVGGTLASPEGLQPTDDVIAFDPRTRSWIELLAPSTGGS